MAKNNTRQKRTLEDAVTKIGGPAIFVREINKELGLRLQSSMAINRHQLYRWRKADKVPAEYVLVVAAITGISENILRPDIYR